MGYYYFSHLAPLELAAALLAQAGAIYLLLFRQ